MNLKLGCCCTHPLTITVKGCNGLDDPGASVAVSQGGSPIPGSPFTTDALGQVGLTPPSNAAALTLVTTDPSPRFAVTTTTIPLTGGFLPAAFTQTLAPASGYHCIGCLLPAADVLNYTDSAYGITGQMKYGLGGSAGTMAVGSAWSIYYPATPTAHDESVSYPGSGSCFAQTFVGIAFVLSGSGVLSYQYAGNTADGGVVTYCPRSGGVNPGFCSVILSRAVDSRTCPPSLNLVYNLPFLSRTPIYPSGTTLAFWE